MASLVPLMTTSPLHDAVAAVIHAALPAECGLEPAEVAQLLSPPPNPEMGDLAFGCFRLAKAMRMPPPKIAADLAQRVASGGIVSSAVAAGPYLNLRLSMAEAGAAVLPELARGLPEPAPRRSEKVMVEFSQPNTHKAFHVGHMRNLSLGDAIVRLLRADGYEVVAANYLGDVGAHIAKCLWWYVDILDDAARRPPDVARGEWLGELYSAASNQLDEWQDAAKSGDEEAAGKLQAARARTTEILQKLEARDPDLTAVWEKTRQWSIEEFDEIYRWCMVNFDRVFFESEVDEPGLRIVEEYLKKGVFVQSEGAVGIYNEEVKHMPFFMLRKSDGTSLYATKDLALARLKFEEHDVDRSIYVVDSRQSDHFRHVFATLDKMGFEQAKKCQHVPYEMVELPSGAMATRKGNVILFRALRERMLEHLEQAYLAKYRGQWPDEEIAQVAHFLALGAIKYGMLNRDVNQKIVFDFEAWLELEGNTGPYLQYTAARAGSILRKGEAAGKRVDTALLENPAALAAAVATLEQPEERELVLALASLRLAVAQAAQALRPSVLCNYLHGLAKSINRFGTAKHCRVIQSEGDLLQARLVLVTAAHKALVWGLARLGIPAPERM
jgi:arginyl-tRNA synthetase